MKCALAAMGFVNKDVRHNQKVILDTLSRYCREADLIVFGEAFLQGFDGVSFRDEEDSHMAVSLSDPVISEIRAAAKAHACAISFGLIEKADSCFYSSQLTIGADGTLIDIFRRVSAGWKESFASEAYREGKGFHTFPFMGKNIAVGLCGDLWYDENVEEMKRLCPDVVLWPVYTDFTPEEWNTSEKYDYARQAQRIGEVVLYVNSVCKNTPGSEVGLGGAALFSNGRIIRETPSGGESILFVLV